MIDKLAHSLQKFTFDTLVITRLSGHIWPVLAPGDAPVGQFEVVIDLSCSQSKCDICDRLTPL